jgi:hypothetical protein
VRSIPRRYPHEHVLPGERQDMCAYCGARWYRSELRRDASGYLICPDDDDGGRDRVTLDRGNAAAAMRPRLPPPEER